MNQVHPVQYHWHPHFETRQSFDMHMESIFVFAKIKEIVRLISKYIVPTRRTCSACLIWPGSRLNDKGRRV